MFFTEIWTFGLDFTKISDASSVAFLVPKDVIHLWDMLHFRRSWSEIAANDYHWGWWEWLLRFFTHQYSCHISFSMKSVPEQVQHFEPVELFLLWFFFVGRDSKHKTHFLIRNYLKNLNSQITKKFRNSSTEKI